MSQFAIASFQLNTETNYKHGIYKKASIDGTTSAPSNEPTNHASQRLPDLNDARTGLEAKGQNTQTKPDKYDVDQIVSHENSRNEFCYRDS